MRCATSAAERMTADAGRGGRFVGGAIAMTTETRRAIAARERTVRGVAGRARRVTRARVKSGWLRVTARARRRRRRTGGAVRAMAGRAREHLAVTGLCLRGMTGRARGCRGARIVWRVATRAGLVSRRCGARFGDVTARARRALRGCVQRIGVAAGAARVAGVRRRRDARLVTARARDRWLAAVCGVAARARGVAGVCRRGGAIGVTARARDLRGDGLAAVRGVAVEAGRGRVRDLGMTARAGQRLRGAERGAVRRMARDARGRVLDTLLVTAGARLRRVVVLRVARRARRVGGEHRLRQVTRGARLHLGAREGMRRVAAGARAMSRRDRGLGHAQGGRLRGVAAHAVDRGRLVHAMAIQAATHAGVRGLLGRMARGAGLRREGRRAMRAVALAARLIGVQPDGVEAALRLRMTRDARLRRVVIRAERVAVATGGAATARVQRHLDRRVTHRADLGGRRCEAAIPVALGARHLADVRGVTGALLHVAIRDRHLLGNDRARTAARDEHDEDRDADHGRDPIGWQSRHGIAATGSRLDQPGGCGFPPTPPTA